MPVLGVAMRARVPRAGRDEPRKDDEAAGRDDEIVKPALELTPRSLTSRKRAPLRAVLRRKLLERDDAVREAPQLKIAVFRRAVVEQQHGAVAPGEELLQAENLPAVAQRLARQQAHLGQRIEDHAAWRDPLDLA